MLILNWSTDGWFFYHVIHIGSADPIETRRLVNFVIKEIFGVMAGISLTALIAGIIGAQDCGMEGFTRTTVADRDWPGYPDQRDGQDACGR